MKKGKHKTHVQTQAKQTIECEHSQPCCEHSSKSINV